MTVDWRPTAPLANLYTRARVLKQIRAFFDQRGVLEVETPVLSVAAATDPHLDSFVTRYDGPGGARPLYLHTSPEFAMKRLLAAGSGPVYQICKAFRNGEAGRLHNPEFTMLEWYRPGFDHIRLMDEVETLVRTVLAVAPARRCAYRELFLDVLGIDPFTAGVAELRRIALAHGVTPPALDEHDHDAWLQLLLTHLVEPRLEGLVFVYDFPVSQAMLARVRPADPPVAERFELYLDGIELANGFHELADADEQRRRFEADLAVRRQCGMLEPPLDTHLLDALAAGLPACAGVALGVDRLVMAACDVASVAEVITFPYSNC